MKQVLSVLFLACCVAVQAQRLRSVDKNQPVENSSPLTYQRGVSFNPLALAQIDFTFLAGYEHRWKKQLVFLGEAGYIFGSLYLGDGSNNASARGFLIRPALKAFIGKDPHFYIQGQAFYKQVTHYLEDWVGKDAVNGVPAYEKFEEFRYRRHVYGANFIIGRMRPLGLQGKAFLDIYLGVGVRNKKEKVLGEPNSVYDQDGGVLVDDPLGHYSVPCGLRFLFVIN